MIGEFESARKENSLNISSDPRQFEIQPSKKSESKSGSPDSIYGRWRFLDLPRVVERVAKPETVTRRSSAGGGEKNLPREEDSSLPTRIPLEHRSPPMPEKAS